MKTLIWVLLAVIFACSSAVPARSDNVETPVRIENPATPPASNTVRLKELWHVGGNTEAEGEVFGRIADLVVDGDGNVYVLDDQIVDVRMFSRDGRFLRSFGREGEGPGKFRQPLGLVTAPGDRIGVYQAMSPRLVLFDRTGAPAGDLEFESDPDHGFQLLGRIQWGGGSFIVNALDSRPGAGALDRVQRLLRYDTSGKFQCEISQKVLHLDRSNPVMRDEHTPYAAVDAHDVAYVADSWNYDITVSGPGCGADRVMTRKYEHRQRTGSEIKSIEAYYRRIGETQGVHLEVSKVDPDITWMGIGEDGRLWVLSSRGRVDISADSMGLFDVYDASGALMRTVDLRGTGNPVTDRYFLIGDRFYVVRHYSASGHEKVDEAEPMSVICYQMPH
jgi:hypothetical protein